jgi:hypothetical protein
MNIGKAEGRARLKMMLLSVAHDARTRPPPQNFTDECSELGVRKDVT